MTENIVPCQICNLPAALDSPCGFCAHHEEEFQTYRVVVREEKQPATNCDQNSTE